MQYPFDTHLTVSRWPAFSLLTVVLVFLLLSGCRVKEVVSAAHPIQHDEWDALLNQHVNEQGLVDYQGLQADSVRFNRYLELLSRYHPNRANWTRDERLAYWINAYNAFTVKLVVDHYPTASIKDIKAGIPFINGVFDLEFIEIEGHRYSLNNIEHGIIRPRFREPRIHFAINCAARSCPRLANFAYRAEQIEAQLEQATRDFVNGDKNRLRPDRVQLSKILSWYWLDFRKHYDSRIDFLNAYSENTTISPSATVAFLDYDWRLNDLNN